MATYNDYIAYFKRLAELFLNHSEVPGEENKTFYRAGLNEFLNGMISDVEYPAMLLDSYDYTYNDNGGDNVRKVRTVAFIIIDHVTDIEDFAQIDNARDNAELILDKIYNQIREDKKNPECMAFLQYADLSNVQVSPVDYVPNGDYGYFCTVDVSSVHNIQL